MSIQLTFAILLMVVAYKIGDWRNWKSYYGTILFLALGDLMYRFLFEDKLLWVHSSIYFSEKQIQLIWLLIIYPCTVLLFLTFYVNKKSLRNKTIYILFWILGYSIWELILLKLGRIIYNNGWNYYWSVGFNFFMFPNLALHYSKPFWSMGATFIFTIIIMHIFLGTIKI